MKLPLQLEIILPCTVALINLLIDGIISFSHPWLIDLKINTNCIFIGAIIHLSKPFPCIWIPGFKYEMLEMKYLQSLSTQTKANLSNFFSLSRSDYPFRKPLRSRSISENFDIQKPLAAVFTTPMKLNPHFLSW